MSHNYASWGTGAHMGQQPSPHASGPPPHPPAQGVEPRIKLPPLTSLAPAGSESTEQQGHHHAHHSIPPRGPPPPPQDVSHRYTQGPHQAHPPGQYVNGPAPHNITVFQAQPPPPPPPPQAQHHQWQCDGQYDDPRRHGIPNGPAYAVPQPALYTSAPPPRDRTVDMHNSEHYEADDSGAYGQPLSSYQPVHHADASAQSTSSTSVHGGGQGRPDAKTGVVIPNLLGEDKAHLIPTLKFELSLRQQPKAARACGAGERDRRTIDPPPVLQLHISSDALTQDDIGMYLRHEPYVMTAEIYDETGTYECARMPAEFKHQRRMTGSLVGNPFFGKDEFGREGTFFPFGDLSVRSLGTYTLKFHLYMIDPKDPRSRAPCLGEITSSPFQSYAAKGFPGIQPSSKLVRVLREQGCIISIKKGHDKKRPYRDSAEPSDGEDDDDSMGGVRRRT